MDPCFWSNRIVGGGFVFDCSKHYRGIARLGMYLVRRGHQIRGVVGQLRNGHRDLPKKSQWRQQPCESTGLTKINGV
jgi:hypothetical protein